MNYETTPEIETAIAHFIGIRKNLIIPNISWGIGIHECDLFVLTASGYAWEVEIKVSRSDLVRDQYKSHHHEHNKIKRLYFGIPENITPHLHYIPENAGIIVVNIYGVCRKIREAKTTGNYKFSEAERFKIARLGSMRIWSLKKKIIDAN